MLEKVLATAELSGKTWSAIQINGLAPTSPPQNASALLICK